MPKIEVRVWWSTGTGDGDDYDSEIELSNEAILALCDAEAEDLLEVDNQECQEAYEQLMEEFGENSQDGDDEYQEYLEECKENDEEPESYAEWFENSGCSVGVDVSNGIEPYMTHEMTYGVTCCLGGGDGGDTEVEVETTTEEILALCNCVKNDIEMCDCDELEDLIERISEEVYDQQSEFLTEDELDNMSLSIGIPDEIDDLATEPDFVFRMTIKR